MKIIKYAIGEFSILGFKKMRFLQLTNTFMKLFGDSWSRYVGMDPRVILFSLVLRLVPLCSIDV